MKLPFKQRVNAIIAKGLAPQLKSHGYRKRGRTFWLEGDNHTKIVSINSSGRNLPELGAIGSYGIEIGVFFPEVFQIGNRNDISTPTIHECSVHSGLPLDGWGFFDDLQGGYPSVDAQTKALENAWDDYGEQWLAQYCQPTDALQWALEAEEWIEALYFSIHLKRAEQAAECYEKCREIFGGEWLAYLEDIARRHGVSGAD